VIVFVPGALVTTAITVLARRHRLQPANALAR
jgi:hypothetical protein